MENGNEKIDAKGQQELIFKLTAMEQQMQQIQQRLQVVEQNLVEMASLNVGLGDLGNMKDKEIVAHIGMGVFTKAKIISDDLLVDVGDKKFVKKSVQDTQDLIKEQMGKLEEVKIELNVSMENLSREAQKMMGMNG